MVRVVRVAISLKHKKQTYCSQVCHAWCCRNIITFYDSNEKDIEQFFKLRGISYDPVTKQMDIGKILYVHDRKAWRD